MENKKIKVSIIIPVYNTAPYVGQAVDSITHQSLKELEVIIIDDGSTDESPTILKEASMADPRIRIYTQANRGISATRNLGLSHARGQYIYFMDSDDLLQEDAIALCYRKCEEEMLDFVFFDAQIFFEDNLLKAPMLSYKRTDKLNDKVIYSGIEALALQLQQRIYTPSVCLNFIRRSFLEKIRLQFYPGIIHEDQLFTTLLYLQAKRTACIRREFFQRRMREGSTMTRRFTYRNMEGYLVITREMLSFRKKVAKQQEVQIIIDLYLSQMLNAAVWEAHILRLPERIKLAALCLCKYKKYVSVRTITVLLLKSLFTHH